MADADIIVVGAGLAGLVAAAEAADAGRSVIVLDQEPAASLGGQAWWSLGGLFLVGTPEQRHLGVKDSYELALADWLGSAGFDRPEDHWPREWATAFVQFASGEMRSWIKEQGISLFPVVQWAERGGHQVGGHGNSVPRFHVIWGSGPGVLTPFVRRVTEHVRTGRIRLLYRHRVTELLRVRLGGDRRGRRNPAAEHRRPRGAVEPGSRRRLLPVRGGGDRRVRRNRRQSGAGPAELAGRAAGGPGRDAVRGARFHRRSDARGHRTGRWPGDQPGPDVALPGGRRQPFPGVDLARHPHPVRPEPAVAGRPRPPAADPALSRLRRARRVAAHPRHRLLALLVPARPEDHRARVRPVRVRAEPGLRREVGEVAADHQGRRQGHPTGAGVPGQGHRLPDGTHRRRAGRQDERAGRRAADRRRRGRQHGGAAGRPGAVGSGQGPAGDRGAGRPPVLRRQADADRGAARDAGPRGRAADRGAAARDHPQDPGRPGDRSVRPGAAARRPTRRRAVRGRRGGRIRRRRDARLPRTGGQLPRWLPVLRPDRRPGGGLGRPERSRPPTSLWPPNG